VFLYLWDFDGIFRILGLFGVGIIRIFVGFAGYSKFVIGFCGFCGCFVCFCAPAGFLWVYVLDVLVYLVLFW